MVTASIGLATFIAEKDSAQEINFDDFVHQADLQMYEAKASGKNCISHVCLKTAVVPINLGRKIMESSEPTEFKAISSIVLGILSIALFCMRN